MTVKTSVIIRVFAVSIFFFSVSEWCKSYLTCSATWTLDPNSVVAWGPTKLRMTAIELACRGILRLHTEYTRNPKDIHYANWVYFEFETDTGRKKQVRICSHSVCSFAQFYIIVQRKGKEGIRLKMFSNCFDICSKYFSLQ